MRAHRLFPATAFLLLTSACASHGVAPAPASELRVLIYNMHAGKDAEGVNNLERISGVVRETGADLVLLQEVDRGTLRSGGVDQPATLARLTGLHAAFGSTLDYQGGEYGIALLSRWPILSDTLLPLPVDPPQERAGGSREPRGMLRAHSETPGGRLHILNTHLDASSDDRWRIQEVRGLLDEAGRLRASGSRVLLGGDLNATPESAVIRALREAGWTDAWEGCGVGEGFTYPARQPLKRIDYLFLSPGLRCLRAQVVGNEVSDHRGLLVLLESV